MPSDTGIHDYIAGAIGGTAGLIVGHPFDTTKVQLQTQHHGYKYKGSLDAIKHIGRTASIEGFFRGLSWPVMTQGVVNSVIFGVYGSTLTYLEPDKAKRQTDYGRIYFAGCVAGAVQLAIVIPVDYIKVVLQAQLQNSSRAASTKSFFLGPMDCAKTIVRDRGLPGLYKGGVAMAYREIPSMGINYVTYEYLSSTMRKHNLTDSKGIIADLVAGGVAGCTMWGSIIPFDVIKSRYQADFSGEYKGFVHCAKMLYKEGGIRIFYTGCLITCLRAFPVNAVTFLVYSQSLKHLEAHY